MHARECLPYLLYYLLIGLMLAFSHQAHAQLIGTDTAPGSSCAGFPSGAVRLTADADQDGKSVKLICNGTTWEKAAFKNCTTVGDAPVWAGASWKCSSVFSPDASPTAFSFVNQNDVPLSSLIASNTETITGIDVPIFVRISGDGSPELNIDASGWTTSGFIASGQTLQIRVTSAASSVETSTVTLNIGTSSAIWTVTTLNTACADTSFQGYCWYASAASENCDSACASHGGCDAPGLAYGNASNANCQNILDELSIGSGGVIDSGPDAGLGCFTQYGWRWRDFNATCAGSYVDAVRACACNS